MAFSWWGSLHRHLLLDDIEMRVFAWGNERMCFPCREAQQTGGVFWTRRLRGTRVSAGRRLFFHRFSRVNDFQLNIHVAADAYQRPIWKTKQKCIGFWPQVLSNHCERLVSWATGSPLSSSGFDGRNRIEQETTDGLCGSKDRSGKVVKLNRLPPVWRKQLANRLEKTALRG